MNNNYRTITVQPAVERERWASVQGYEGLYEISSLGRCKGLRLETKFGNQTKVYPVRILKPKKRKGKYSSYILCNDGKHTTHMIHRLVALHFIQNPHSKKHVNHKDGYKWNNSIDNLEWCTSSENLEHAMTTGLNKNFGETAKAAKLSEKQVIEIRKKYIPKIYTQQMLADEYKISKRTIMHICQRTSWKRIAL